MPGLLWQIPDSHLLPTAGHPWLDLLHPSFWALGTGSTTLTRPHLFFCLSVFKTSYNLPGVLPTEHPVTLYQQPPHPVSLAPDLCLHVLQSSLSLPGEMEASTLSHKHPSEDPP